MSFVTANGQRVTRARIEIPLRGAWWGSFTLDTDAELVGSITLTLGDLELVGTVSRGGIFEGAAAYRIDAGAGAWGNELAPKGYRGASVRLQTVLADLCRDAGEILGTAHTDRSLGDTFVREAGPGARVLEQLAGGAGWYVDAAGFTQVAARPAPAIVAENTLVDFDPEARRAVIATETPAVWQPGATIGIDGTTWTLSSVRLELEPEALRVHLLLEDGAREDLLVRAFRSAVREVDPRRTFASVYEYRVISHADELLDLQPVASGLGLPALARVRQRPGVAGTGIDPRPGSTCVVAFLNADPTKPVVLGYDQEEADEIRLGAPAAAQFVALEGKVDDRLGQLFTAFSNATVVAMDGGASLKSTFLAALALLGWSTSGVTPSVGAEKVKAE